jgi:hypothetical protein
MAFVNKIYNYLRDFFIFLSFRTKHDYEEFTTNECDDKEEINFNQFMVR